MENKFSLTLDLPEKMYRAIVHTAEVECTTPEAWAIERLRAVTLTPEDIEAALQRLLRHTGVDCPADADLSHNQQIDADLAREYAATHQEG